MPTFFLTGCSRLLGDRPLITTMADSVLLKGFAVLPADTFAAGPSSGNFITGTTNGRTLPFPGQPVQGFSAVQFADGNNFWFMPDNGFGAKNNSADFLLRVYRVDPNFRGSEAGDGTVNIQNFIQLADPDRKVPFEIANQTTGDRLLTGFDFDIESFVIARNNTLWFGEEFGPFVFNTDATGKVLSAPLYTPNYFNIPTLNGQAPLVIGHRGASGELPEHTIEAYRLAILRGADFIEPDLVATKDGVLIARHEPTLGTTTDVATRPEFASRRRNGVIDGVLYENEFFASDFTLAEIKTLRAIMPQSFRTDAFDGVFQIPTLEDVINLVQEVEAETGKKIGIYPETKHPTYHDQLGLSLEEPLLATLEKTGFTDRSRVFIQSFEVSNLKELNTKTDIPLVQLLDAFDVDYNTGELLYQDVNARPFDFTVKGDTRTYADLQTPTGLAEIATYADGIGPWKRMIVSVRNVDRNNDGRPDDLNNDGVINDADRVTLPPSSLITNAHQQGLFVHAYTFRNEGRFLASNYNNNPELEYRQFIQLGVDGYFTDFPGTGDLVRDQITAPFVRSPQDPGVLSTPNFNTLNGQTPLVLGHRGASGDRPEHTLAAYKKAIADGADFIEPDLVVTKDGVLIARHEPMLAVVQLNADGTIRRDANGNPVLNTTDTSTDIYLRPEFTDRLTVKRLDGNLIGGWWAEDLTLAEIKTLNAIERLPALRSTAFDQDGLKVPTLAEVIALVKEVEADTGRKIGIYPETKHPSFFAVDGRFVTGVPINYNTSEILVKTLVANNFTDPSRVFIQSFEVGNLRQLNDVFMPAAGIDVPLIQLFGGGGRPYDFVLSGDTRTYTDLSTPAGLADIATYAAGIGPNKQRIVPLSTVDRNGDGRPDDLNGDGLISDGDRITGTPTTLIQDAHRAGLLVHAYTLRNESFFLPASYNGDPTAEYRQLIDLGVDGFFTDFSRTGHSVVVNDYLAGTGFRGGSQQYYGDLIVSNLGGSRGYEGMAINPDKSRIFPLLEGFVIGDPTNALRIHEFDPAKGEFVGLAGYYRMENPAHAIGDFTVINDNEYLVIERDGGQAAAAQFKKVFKVDLSKRDANGFVEKVEVVDLLNIQDPNDLNRDGNTVYRMPFVTIEDALVLDSKTILIANDNNYPFSIGRPPAIDNNEIVVLELSQSLNLDPRSGNRSFLIDQGESVVVNRFQAVGTGVFPGAETIAEADTLRFRGVGLTANNLLLTQQGADLRVSFEGNTTSVLLNDIRLEAIDNLTRATGAGVNLGNILFDGETVIRDSFDVFNADWNFEQIFNRNTATFLNDLNNVIRGFDNSNDVINGQGGDDILRGLSGADTLRGGAGNDTLIGGIGSDVVVGNSGADVFVLAVGSGTDTIRDFSLSEGDRIGLAGGLSFGSLTVNQAGADAVIRVANETLAVVTGVQASTLVSSAFTTIAI